MIDPPKIRNSLQIERRRKEKEGEDFLLF